jgi:23S rRNA (guanosine2251-2'-O)-methyltransferase
VHRRRVVGGMTRRARGGGRSKGSGRSGNGGGRAPQGRTPQGRPQRGGHQRGGHQRGRATHSRARSSDRSLGGEQIEGRQAVRELLIANRRRVREVLIADDIERSPVMSEIIDVAKAQRVTLRAVSRREIDDQARSEAPQGVLAYAEPLAEVLLDEVLARRSGGESQVQDGAGTKKLFLVAVDGVTDPGNLGAILRSCEGAGVDAVLLPRHRAVHITPTAAKAAAGAVEYLDMCVVPGLPTAIQILRENDVWVVGLDDSAEKNLFELGDLAREHLCVVLGAEGAGLSRLVRERCDMLVSIPMRGALSSLNVSAAAALAAYEVVRARAE